MRALVFDFDGVIVDSEPIHEEGLRRACAPLGIAVREGLSIGLADEDAVRLIFEEAGVELTPDVERRLLREKGRYVESVFTRGEAPPYPGTLNLIRAASAAGLPLAVCSAAFEHEIRAVLGHLAITNHFRTIVAFDHVPRAKPDPAGYLLAAQRLGIPPSDCIAIEDSPRGVTAARAAGMTTIALLHTTPRESLIHAHYIAESVDALTLDTLRTIHSSQVPS
ncbi:MAG TPA: HAD family phosphatase [Phycisphaerales bacterium]|nr:HAD family phosphatase [Phycisphaerales bacterium]